MSTRTTDVVTYYEDDDRPILYRHVPPSDYGRWTGHEWIWSEALHKDHWLGGGDLHEITEARARVIAPEAF